MGDKGVNSRNSESENPGIREMRLRKKEYRIKEEKQNNSEALRHALLGRQTNIITALLSGLLPG